MFDVILDENQLEDACEHLAEYLEAYWKAAHGPEPTTPPKPTPAHNSVSRTSSPLHNLLSRVGSHRHDKHKRKGKDDHDDHDGHDGHNSDRYDSHQDHYYESGYRTDSRPDYQDRRDERDHEDQRAFSPDERPQRSNDYYDNERSAQKDHHDYDHDYDHRRYPPERTRDRDVERGRERERGNNHRSSGEPRETSRGSKDRLNVERDALRYESDFPERGSQREQNDSRGRYESSERPRGSADRDRYPERGGGTSSGRSRARDRDIEMEDMYERARSGPYPDQYSRYPDGPRERIPRDPSPSPRSRGGRP